MTANQAHEIWSGILKILDEKLQYGLLKQVDSVVDVKIDGDELSLCVSDDEAFDFFQAEVNQQRLIILARPVIFLETIKVIKVDAEPLR